ncbi:hypothetical protein CPB84DRAFT_1784083 [Gymnopilus junonius]|uniref:F-box domain-containing protein n=1 Tax=Gymnopilus junonius TaxID=109634 RepID=A0A9P5NLV6_GYMJU|nr:hypothetical protein CPB84DRAFT_1784083 [Gymnopilus junonius]
MAATSIDSLPPEILSVIFKYVYAAQAVDLGCNYGDDNEEEEEDLDKNGSVSSPTDADEINMVSKLSSAVKEPWFFPYALAAVCHHWEDVLSSTPRFWNTVLIRLNRGEAEIERIWRCALPGSLRALVPHLHRCRTLWVDVTMNVSIPILPGFLPCATPLLRHVNLTCLNGSLGWDEDKREHTFSMDSFNWTDDSDSDSDVAREIVEFKPRLKTLGIDGRNLQRAFAEDKHWIKKFDNLQELTIAYYQPIIAHGLSKPHTCDACGLSIYSVLELVQSSPRLTHLQFRFVTFLAPPIPQELLPTYDLSALQRITFVDIQPNIIQAVLNVCHFSEDSELQTLIFGRCPRLGDVEFPPLPMASLQLYSLAEDVDLRGILHRWGGQYLVIHDCASFSDSVLNMLSAPEDDNDDDDGRRLSFPCNALNVLSLHFKDSPPYSIGALKELVGSRGIYGDYNDDRNWIEHAAWGPVIHTIRLSGKVPHISMEDETWFHRRLAQFVYES